MSLSSMIVKVTSGKADQLLEVINLREGLEVSDIVRDNLVVICESKNMKDLNAKIDDLQLLDDVIHIDQVYHNTEDLELEIK